MVDFKVDDRLSQGFTNPTTISIGSFCGFRTFMVDFVDFNF